MGLRRLEHVTKDLGSLPLPAVRGLAMRLTLMAEEHEELMLPPPKVRPPPLASSRDLPRRVYCFFSPAAIAHAACSFLLTPFP